MSSGFEAGTYPLYMSCMSCTTALVVNVPCDAQYGNFTVVCETCKSEFLVNTTNISPPLGAATPKEHAEGVGCNFGNESASSSRSVPEGSATTHIEKPEKKQRVPTPYNIFIKDEIQRIKAQNPDISHKQAFSAAAKSWAHHPRYHGSANCNQDEEDGGSSCKK
eukprot:TRINITY_DN2944_c0_g1_i4.p1 TRINITY_DN2944_c0_g1~~TRINITY_DN2944_c0_g1_i4.p1  ORF type:complete len:164 (+),score=2.57 TRINITY_DN2944_c0_g1_i4:264-755(+)